MKTVIIGAVWCPACLVMKKVLKNVLEDYNLDITNLDYDVDNDIVKQYDVGKILPVVIFMDGDSTELERVVGEIGEDKLRVILDRLVMKCNL